MTFESLARSYIWIVVLVVGVTAAIPGINALKKLKLKTSDKNYQQTFAEKYFDIGMSTIDFFCLSIATCGFYYLYILYNLSKKSASKYDFSEINFNISEIIKIDPLISLLKYLPFAFFAFIILWSWGNNIITTISSMSLVFDVYDYSRKFEKLFNRIEIITWLGSYILLLLTSYRIGKFLEEKFKEFGINTSINIFLCLIFPIFYQYYKIYNSKVENGKRESETVKSGE